MCVNCTSYQYLFFLAQLVINNECYYIAQWGTVLSQYPFQSPDVTYHV